MEKFDKIIVYRTIGLPVDESAIQKRQGMARKFVINNKLKVWDKPWNIVCFRYGVQAGFTFGAPAYHRYSQHRYEQDGSSLPRTKRNNNICVNMLEIGTYHFTYIGNCRVCCAAVFLCTRTPEEERKYSEYSGRYTNRRDTERVSKEKNFPSIQKLDNCVKIVL